MWNCSRSGAGGRRGIIQARKTIGLADAGAQSPKESWLRTVLVEAGLPRPQTQIPIHDEWGVSPSRTSIWAGRTSRSPSNTTAIITEPAAPNTPTTFADRRWCNVGDGSLSE